MRYQAVLSKLAVKDLSKLRTAKLGMKAKSLVDLLSEDPFKTSPFYENLIGDLVGKYSRRINIQHRLVYEVYEAERIVKVLRMWSHYE